MGLPDTAGCGTELGVELIAAQELAGRVAAESGAQSRYDFWRVVQSGGGRLRVESTAAALLDAARVGFEGAGVNVECVLLPVAFPADRLAWVQASVAEVRREPRHAAEQVTQVLQGETVVPLVHEDGWLLGRVADGYVGWIRDWHLQWVDVDAVAGFTRRVNARIDANWTCLRAEPSRTAVVVGESILGTPVVTRRDERGWMEIELPGGRCGWLPVSALRDAAWPWRPQVAEIAATLQRFYGVPYLWGGRSPKGFDCSGLVQFVFGLHGVLLPRDSDAQALAGEPVAEPRPGDLVFFGRERVTHVGVVRLDGAFVHARGEVRYNSLVHGADLHDAELAALWCGTRRVLGPAAAPPPA